MLFPVAGLIFRFNWFKIFVPSPLLVYNMANCFQVNSVPVLVHLFQAKEYTLMKKTYLNVRDSNSVKNGQQAGNTLPWRDKTNERSKCFLRKFYNILGNLCFEFVCTAVCKYYWSASCHLGKQLYVSLKCFLILVLKGPIGEWFVKIFVCLFAHLFIYLFIYLFLFYLLLFFSVDLVPSKARCFISQISCFLLYASMQQKYRYRYIY